MRQQEFLALLIFSTLFALTRGGRPEKIGAIALFAGALISFLVVRPRGLRFRHIETGILMTDIALLGIFLWLTFRCTRFWPIWISGLLGAETLVHLGLIVAPQVHWEVYLNATALWSWLIQLMLVIGTWRHQMRLMQNGRDPPWRGNIN
ncbi:hypothetical protein [Novosphingobium sediminicola]|uniref:Uncharacterized protein n=1 Tax=Novosphingobium sediminicola TaxID=563162 RepID=A0A7W6CMD1_9SPHN|nr:hypothetical protein [Novosphingobium sediminicola]MBB3957068.1 hypothetical protein [Novosphingobium sediminicola]